MKCHESFCHFWDSHDLPVLFPSSSGSSGYCIFFSEENSLCFFCFFFLFLDCLPCSSILDSQSFGLLIEKSFEDWVSFLSFFFSWQLFLTEEVAFWCRDLLFLWLKVLLMSLLWQLLYSVVSQKCFSLNFFFFSSKCLFLPHNLSISCLPLFLPWFSKRLFPQANRKKRRMCCSFYYETFYEKRFGRTKFETTNAESNISPLFTFFFT